MTQPEWFRRDPERHAGQAPFTCHRMDVPPRREKGGLGVLVSLICMTVIFAVVAGYALWGAI